MTTPSDDDARRIDLEVEVPGTPEQVWEAIATGPGITAWMHPTEVEEREGGEFTYDMGSGMTGSGTVTGWDPPRRFAQEDSWQPGGDAEGEGERRMLATEWLIEARSGGTCVVRMVMSGFGPGTTWDEEIEGMTEGMWLALDTLRLYMTSFAGDRGSWVRALGSATGSRDDNWAALSGALGLPADATEGTRFDTPGPAGAPALSGVVETVVDKKWHRGLQLRIEEPAPGLVHALAFGERGWMTLQACLYGEQGAAVAQREEPAWQAWMRERLPAGDAATEEG